MLGCLKSCIRHPKQKRNKARPSYTLKPDTVVHTPVCLPQRNASPSSLSLRENVVLECATPTSIPIERIPPVEEIVIKEERNEEESPPIMGMTEESVVHAELASATIPKERKFQVVRVPGVFTRGRWKCWDYREDVKPVDGGLTFTDDKENESSGTVTVTASTSVSTTVSEPIPGTTQSPQREESSTIVVTSIAPAPPTPQHGTPSSISEMPTPPYSFTDVHAAPGDWSASTPTTTVTITSSLPPAADTVVVHSVASAPSVIPPDPSSSVPLIHSATPSTTSAASFDAPPAAAATVGAVVQPQVQQQQSSIFVEEIREPESSSISSEIGGGGATPTHNAPLVSTPSPPSASAPPTVSNPSPSPEMTRSGSERGEGDREEESTPAATAISNVAAIDNKIEQAMDLVKTHLTFAVREEVEVLRNTIAELESKVSTLEKQNDYLKRHVSPEVLSSLPGMVQQHKISLPATAAPVQLQQVPSATSAPSTNVSPSLAAAVQHESAADLAEAAAAAATRSPSAYCPATTNFVNSLNTVVNQPSSTINPLYNTPR